MATTAMSSYHVEFPTTERNRLSVAFRPLLALPHALFVGGPGVGVGIAEPKPACSVRRR